jgi:hypothetical protein
MADMALTPRQTRNSWILTAVLSIAIGLALWLRLRPTLPDLSAVLRDSEPQGSMNFKSWALVNKVDFYRTKRTFDDLTDSLKSAGWLQTTRRYGREFLFPNTVHGYTQVSVVVENNTLWRTFEIRWRTNPLSPEEKTLEAEALAHPDTMPAQDRTEQSKIDAEKPILDKLQKIIKQIGEEHKLSKSDTQFLLASIRQTDLEGIAFASLALKAAVENGLYRKQDLLSLLERLSGQLDSPTIFMQDYRNLLDIGVPSDRRLKSEFDELLAKHLDRNKLNSEEKALIDKALATSSDSNKILAGYIVFEKQNLDLDSITWISARLLSQERASTGNVRQFWQYLDRITKAKSTAGQAKPPKPAL